MMLCRALIKTHHMTSRKKIMAITKAAKQYECAVYLKTGMHPPGVMIGECDGQEGEQDLKEWVRSVKVCVHYPAQRRIRPLIIVRELAVLGS